MFDQWLVVVVVVLVVYWLLLRQRRRCQTEWFRRIDFTRIPASSKTTSTSTKAAAIATVVPMQQPPLLMATPQWEHVGCFRTGRNTERAMELVSDAHTFGECLAAAQQRPVPLFALHDGTRCMLFDGRNQTPDRDGRADTATCNRYEVLPPTTGGTAQQQQVVVGGPDQHSVYRLKKTAKTTRK